MVPFAQLQNGEQKNPLQILKGMLTQYFCFSHGFVKTQVCFASLSISAVGFAYGAAWLSRGGLLLPFILASWQLARPDSPEMLAVRLWQEVDPQVAKLQEGEEIEVVSETFSFLWAGLRVKAMAMSKMLKLSQSIQPHITCMWLRMSKTSAADLKKKSFRSGVDGGIGCLEVLVDRQHLEGRCLTQPFRGCNVGAAPRLWWRQLAGRRKCNLNGKQLKWKEIT